MKNLKYIIATLFVVAVGVGIFWSCEKENESINSTKNSSIKTHKSIEETNSFELYTPNVDSIVYFLTNMTNYMNQANEYPMPDIELSKAVWIMESFFNIGVCDKQNKFCEEATSTQTYTLELDIDHDENANVVVNGNDLQTQYHSLLKIIINDICPQYAMEFGDVYVNSLEMGQKKVYIGFDVKYGIKAESTTSTFSRLCFASENQTLYAPFSNNVSYPANNYQLAYVNNTFNFRSVRDTKMEKVLKCRHLEYLFNIIKFDNYFLFTYYNSFPYDHCGNESGSDPGDFVAHHHDRLSTRIGSGVLTPAEYSYYGDVYRDSIYAKIVPLIPSGYMPFKAACFYFCIWPVSMDFPTLDFHEFGIEYICKYISLLNIPQCEDLIEVKFNINCPCLCD